MQIPDAAVEMLTKANVHIEHYWNSEDPIPRDKFLHWFELVLSVNPETCIDISAHNTQCQGRRWYLLCIDGQD
jgi:hypothetical protein